MRRSHIKLFSQPSAVGFAWNYLWLRIWFIEKNLASSFFRKMHSLRFAHQWTRSEITKMVVVRGHDINRIVELFWTQLATQMNLRTDRETSDSRGIISGWKSAGITVYAVYSCDSSRNQPHRNWFRWTSTTSRSLTRDPSKPLFTGGHAGRQTASQPTYTAEQTTLKHRRYMNNFYRLLFRPQASKTWGLGPHFLQRRWFASPTFALVIALPTNIFVLRYWYYVKIYIVLVLNQLLQFTPATTHTLYILLCWIRLLCMPTVLSDSETGEAYSAAAVAKKRGKSYKKLIL